jgi:hypothetical protein
MRNRQTIPGYSLYELLRPNRPHNTRLEQAKTTPSEKPASGGVQDNVRPGSPSVKPPGQGTNQRPDA